MSSRIILVNYLEESGQAHLLGLLAEQTTETIRRAEEDFVETGLASDGAPYLGPVTHDLRGMIQRIEINQLLTEQTRDLLFRQPLAAT